MSTVEYWDIETGEPLLNYDLKIRFNDWLDEVFGDVSIGNVSWPASSVLKEMDPTAYRRGFSDWLDSEVGETITEDEPSADDDN